MSFVFVFLVWNVHIKIWLISKSINYVSKSAMILSNVNKIHMERQIQSCSENLDDSRLIAQNPYVRCGACENFVCAWENIGEKKKENWWMWQIPQYCSRDLLKKEPGFLAWGRLSFLFYKLWKKNAFCSCLLISINDLKIDFSSRCTVFKIYIYGQAFAQCNAADTSSPTRLHTSVKDGLAVSCVKGNFNKLPLIFNCKINYCFFFVLNIYLDLR